MKFANQKLARDMLADRYARAKGDFDGAKERLEALRNEVLEDGRDEIVGDRYTVSVDHRVRRALDTETVKGLLTPNQIKLATTKTPYDVLIVEANVAMKEAA